MKLIVCLCLAWIAQENSNPRVDETVVKQEIIADGLYHPFGVAIQPETGHVFVSDSGHQKIIRIVDGKVQDVITEFSIGMLNEDSRIETGPLGLAFLDRETLIVAGSGLTEAKNCLHVFKVPAIGAEPIKASTSAAAVLNVGGKNQTGEFDFFGIAITGSGVYVTGQDDRKQSWIFRADLAEKSIDNFRPYVATNDVVKVDRPSAIVQSPDGFLSVSHRGGAGDHPDSLLAFYDEGGSCLDQLELNLFDVTGMAYSPKRKRLFAVDLSWDDPTKGGLFKIIQSQTTTRCTAIEILKMNRPTSMVFDSEGNLYVTVCGIPAQGAEKNCGSLIKISGLDLPPQRNPRH